MNNLVTKLVLDHKGFDSDLQSSAVGVKQFGESSNSGAQSMLGLNSNMLKGAAAFAGWAGAGVAAKAGFDRFMAGGQETSDWLDEQVAGWNGIVDGFFANLNNGDIAGFLSKMGAVKESIMDATRVGDALNDNLASRDVLKLQYENKLERLRMEYKSTPTKDVDNRKRLATEIRELGKEYTDVMRNSIRQAIVAQTATLNAVVQKSGGFTSSFSSQNAGYKEAYELSPADVQGLFKRDVTGVTNEKGYILNDTAMQDLQKVNDFIARQKEELKKTGYGTSFRLTQKQQRAKEDTDAKIFSEQAKYAAKHGFTTYALEFWNGLKDEEGREAVRTAAKTIATLDSEDIALKSKSSKSEKFLNGLDIETGGETSHRPKRVTTKDIFERGSLGYYDAEIANFKKLLSHETDAGVALEIQKKIDDLGKIKQALMDKLSGKLSPKDELKKGYGKESDTIKRQYVGGVIGFEEYARAQNELADRTLKNVVSLEGVDAMTDEFCGVLRDNIKAFTNLGVMADKLSRKWVMPDIINRDKSFDYKNSLTTVLALELDTTRDNRDNLIKSNPRINDDMLKKIRGAGGKFEGLMDELGMQTDDLLKRIIELDNQEISIKAELKIATLQEDIKNLQKRVRDEGFGLARGMLQGIHSTYSEVKNVIKTLGDDSVDGFDKVFSVIDLIGNSISNITNVIEGIDSMIKVVEMLTGAKQSLTAATSAQTAVEGVAQGVEAAGVATTLATTPAVVAAKETEATASSNAAVAGAASSVASIPVVGWIMAGVAIAGLVAMLATNKFAGGGIVGGNMYSGDNVLARVNSGEMVLNREQQANLFNMINAGAVARGVGGGGVSGGVRFEVSGDKLVGVLNNYERKRRRTR